MAPGDASSMAGGSDDGCSMYVNDGCQDGESERCVRQAPRRDRRSTAQRLLCKSIFYAIRF